MIIGRPYTINVCNHSDSHYLDDTVNGDSKRGALKKCLLDRLSENS